jgi:hypothetical protein
MADERDEQEQPKIVDNRMLSDDDRSGSGSGAASGGPQLEIIGGGSAGDSSIDEASEDEDLPEGDEALLAQGGMAQGGEPELSPEEQEALREQMEQEQFQQIEGQIGRPLTEKEKDQVRQQMEEQAQAAVSLEVAPVLLDLMVKLPNYAAVHLGLMPNPYTQLIARDDNNARLAIDSLGSMFDLLKPMLDTNSRREFERVIADLRANFTRITGQPIGPAAASPIITGPRLIR